MNTNRAPHRLTLRGQIVLSLLWFALGLLSSALLPIVIPTQILLFVTPGHVGNAQQVTFLAWISALGAVVTLFIPPLTGMLSDNTSGSLGRRRPYIIAGSIVILLSVPLLIKANSIAMLIPGLGILLVGVNIITAGYQGLTPDLVPREQRGVASGYMGFMTILGNVGSLSLAAWLFSQVNLHSAGADIIRRGATLYYISTIAVLIIGVIITVIGVREIPFVSPALTLEQAESRIKLQFHEWFVQNWIKPWREHNFTIVFLTRAAVMMGLALFMTFIEYYLANVAHVTNFVQATATVAILALLSAIFSALILGIFSDYVKRVPLVSTATLCMASAALAFVVFPAGFPLWPPSILFGLGYGAYMSVDWALSIDTLPSSETAGKDLGLWNASATLPTVIAPLLGSLIIILFHGSTALGYRLIFAAATLFLILAAIGVLFVRERKESHLAATPRASLKQKLHIGWKLAFQTQAGNGRGFLLFWPLWERITRAIWHLQPVPYAPHHLLEVRFTHYTGKAVDLPDGTHIAKGDPIIELHFRNRAFLEVDEHAPAWRYLQLVAQNLRALAAWIQEPDFPGDVYAIYGTTLLYRAAPRLGFTLRQRPKNIHTYLERFFMMGLLVLYHRRGGMRLLQGTTYGTYPQEAWMSREELLKRYSYLLSLP
ncbi:MFS transporter [Ktedonosporobacter rubrisoli]|uniref:MFS transporter n=1 Tax=Ktedonosporobacter rubrisoli TaxID=2509675 RepID=A0A4P6JPT7_KTERU|nr:MFS transporter [Ktedonosporobacter rubrisoli]QBD77408.1 MFS transporter [Ktedonosporobacter rubrisoli]